METLCNPNPAAAITRTAITGSHQGMPSAAISVNEKMAANAISTAMIGISAAISAGTRGEVSGATRRRQATRVARPTDPFRTLAR